MKRAATLAAAFALTLAMAAGANDEAGISGNKLLLWCSGDDGYGSKMWCEGFTFGVAEVSLLWRDQVSETQCPKHSGVTAEQIIRIAVSYMEQHPGKLHEQGFVLVGNAVAAAFPCEEQ